MRNKALCFVIMLVFALTLNTNVFAATDSTSDQLKQTQDNEKDLQGKIQNLNNQINSVLKQVEKNRTDMNNIAEDSKNTQDKLISTEKDLKLKETELKSVLKSLYVYGNSSYMEVLLGSHSLNDFVSKAQIIGKVITYNNSVVENVKSQRQYIVAEKEKLNSEKAEIQSLKQSNESQLSALSKDVQTQRTLLSNATQKEKQLIAQKQQEEAAQRAAQQAAQQQAMQRTAALAAAKTSSNSNQSSTSAKTTNSNSGNSSVPSAPTAGSTITVQATGYSGGGYTASGDAVTRNPNSFSSIAVDPTVIPWGSKLYIPGYGYGIANDIGGAIRGHIIDLYFSTNADAENWGRRVVTVTILK